MSLKKVLKVVQSHWQNEGRGARVRRSIGRPELKNLDPFLLLDEFQGNANDGAGFPDHPHRGFETVSYLLEGQFIHEDFTGRKGVMGPGDLQWMTAGRGIVHSEMPGPCSTRGLQLWVNLKKQDKMVEPAYQEHLSTDIPTKREDGVSVKVIAGESMGIKSQVRTRTPTYYLDFKLDEWCEEKKATQKSFKQKIPIGWTTFAYILEGNLVFGSGQETISAHNTVVFSSDEDTLMFRNGSKQPAHFVLIAGQPINEPVSQYGPFVMNSEEELQQAMKDFKNCQNGFESAREWKSDEGHR